MTKDELTDWFMEVFWPAYKTLCKTPYVTQWTGGARGECLTKVLQMKPSEKLRERILAAVLEQTHHRKEVYQALGSKQLYEQHTKYNKFYCNRDGRTWLHNTGWMDEIPEPPRRGITAVAPNGICAEPGCNQPVHGPKFRVCGFHLTMRDGR